MDKASVFGTEDCRFESYRGQILAQTWSSEQQYFFSVYNLCEVRLGSVVQAGMPLFGNKKVKGWIVGAITPILVVHEEVFSSCAAARLAQSVERQPFKLVVVGSSPTVGIFSVRKWNLNS